jgi:leucyl aminopeptidase
MQIAIQKGTFPKIKTELLVVSIFEEDSLSKVLEELSDDFAFDELEKLGDFKAASGSHQLLYPRTKCGVKRILLNGLGKREKFSLKTLSAVYGKLGIYLKSADFKAAVVCLPNSEELGPDVNSIALVCARSLETGLWSFENYKSKPKTMALKKLSFYAGDKPAKDLLAAISRGAAIGRGVNTARDLGTHPSNTVDPAYLSSTARKYAKASGGKLKVKVLNENQLQKIGAGGILAVGQGSVKESQLISFEYRCGKKNARKLAVIGKGITFDSGGISLKPGSKMEDMKYDMCGAATVMGIFSVIAEIQPDIDLFGVIPAAENMPDGTSYKPGDVITLHCGKTVEIINTDAEGRLLLCDALSWAEQQYKPDAMLDFATLTGAVLMCLGHEMSAVMGNDPGMVEAVVDAGNCSGDVCWPLPLAEEFRNMVKSPIADIRNSTNTREAGTITAGAFLNEAVSSDTPWAHVDIAGTAWHNKKPGMIAGATGVGVHMIYELIDIFNSTQD